MVSQHSYDEMFEQALNTVNNRFLLSVLLAKRVAQIRKGAEPLVDAQGLTTHEEIVYREIVEGKLEWRSAASPVHAGEVEQDFMGDFDDTE